MKKITICCLFLSILLTEFSNAAEKFLSLKKDKVNVRYGPSFDSKIKYIYTKINLPIKLIDKKENWRRIIDLKNNSGWIHSSQLNEKSNSIIILEDKILFKKSSNLSKPIARVEKGRLLIISRCENHWCSVTTDNYYGWIKAVNIWGSIK
jgi:SH3-like domain-containing protein|tara:strand:- start:674 stop:1123 length:450 start_codon:yes stop_codon:yes gene_type:complete